MILIFACCTLRHSVKMRTWMEHSSCEMFCFYRLLQSLSSLRGLLSSIKNIWFSCMLLEDVQSIPFQLNLNSLRKRRFQYILKGTVASLETISYCLWCKYLAGMLSSKIKPLFATGWLFKLICCLVCFLCWQASTKRPIQILHNV